MKLLIPLLTALVLSATGLCSDPPKLLEKASVLPLALDDSFQFRKTLSFLYDPILRKPTPDPMVNFMWQRMSYGAVTGEDNRRRMGHYLTFYWRSKRKADLTLRLEYRQQNLGSVVQARELYYKGVKGSVKSEFQVIGDDYEEDGRITGWRAILIENGKIVGLNASFLWN
jgi:hypothetical protein